MIADKLAKKYHTKATVRWKLILYEPSEILKFEAGKLIINEVIYISNVS